jgi:hypothetical protein
MEMTLTRPQRAGGKVGGEENREGTGDAGGWQRRQSRVEMVDSRRVCVFTLSKRKNHEKPEKKP